MTEALMYEMKDPADSVGGAGGISDLGRIAGNIWGNSVRAFNQSDSSNSCSELPCDCAGTGGEASSETDVKEALGDGAALITYACGSHGGIGGEVGW